MVDSSAFAAVLTTVLGTLACSPEPRVTLSGSLSQALTLSGFCLPALPGWQWRRGAVVPDLVRACPLPSPNGGLEVKIPEARPWS